MSPNGATIAAELIAGGLDPATPAAAVHRATTDQQEVVRCELADLHTAPIESPAVIVIGPVAALDLTSLVEFSVLSA